MPAKLLCSGGLGECGHLRVYIMPWEMVRFWEGRRDGGREEEACEQPHGQWELAGHSEQRETSKVRRKDKKELFSGK